MNRLPNAPTGTDNDTPHTIAKLPWTSPVLTDLSVEETAAGEGYQDEMGFTRPTTS